MVKKKKGVLYLRVSSNPQEEKGYSIPAQEDLGREEARLNDVEIVAVFQESHSAKEAGRKEFNNMLRFLKKNKDVQHVYAESTNRLLRNEFDSAVIIELATKTELHFHIIKDRMVLSKNSTPMELFMFTMNTAVSSIYPRNLSIDVKKGMSKKAALGFYPGKAPVGYENLQEAKKKRSIVIDDTKAPFVIKAFEMYSTGCYSYKALAEELAAAGFHPGKNPCSKSNIEDILNNPFYMGEFDYADKRYEGQHKPLITKKLFRAVQNRINASGSPRKIKHDFLYQGLIKCAIDDNAVVGELKHGANKSGDYEYYRCTGNRGDGSCGKKYIRREEIDKAVEDLLKSIKFDKETIDKILQRLKNMVHKNLEYEGNAIEAISKKIKTLKTRLDNLYTDRADGVVDNDFYFEKKAQWQEEIDDLQIKHAELASGDEMVMQKAMLILELCERAYGLYLEQDNDEKRIMLKMLCSNFLWDGENLVITLKSPLKTMLSGAILINGGR